MTEITHTTHLRRNFIACTFLLMHSITIFVISQSRNKWFAQVDSVLCSTSQTSYSHRFAKARIQLKEDHTRFHEITLLCI